MALVFSGRDKSVQEDIAKWQKEKDPNFKGTHNAIDVWLVYSEKKVSKNDPRLPARKHAYGATNREWMNGFVPFAKYRSKKCKVVARENYNQLGEESNYELTHSGVQIKALDEIPHLNLQDKESMIGFAPMLDLDNSNVAECVRAKGVPLNCADWTPIAFYSDLFKSNEVTHIFDLSLGQLGAGIAAYYNGCEYAGVCFNEKHKAWSDRVMDRACLAIMADAEKEKNDDDFGQKIKHFFSGYVKDARRMLNADKVDPNKECAETQLDEEDVDSYEDADDDDDEE